MLENILNRIEDKRHQYIEDAIDDDRNALADTVQCLISRISERQKEITQCNSKKKQALEKLMDEAGPSWMTSKYLFAISGLKTAIYRMNICPPVITPT